MTDTCVLDLSSCSAKQLNVDEVFVGSRWDYDTGSCVDMVDVAMTPPSEIVYVGEADRPLPLTRSDPPNCLQHAVPGCLSI